MLNAQTLLGASPVPVTKDTVQVMIMNAVLVLIIVILMLNAATLRGASPAPVTKDTVGVELTILVSYIVFYCCIHFY